MTVIIFSAERICHAEQTYDERIDALVPVDPPDAPLIETARIGAPQTCPRFREAVIASRLRELEPFLAEPRIPGPSDELMRRYLNGYPT